MADYRYFRCKFWADSYIQDLLPEEKLLYIYLFTNEHGNQAGIYPITFRTIAFESGIEPEKAEAIITKFKKDGKCVYENNVMWIKNFVRHQTTKSPTVLKSIAKDLEQLNNSNLIDQFLKYNNTVSIPYQYPTDTLPIPKQQNRIEVEVQENKKDMSTEKPVDVSLTHDIEEIKAFYYEHIRKLRLFDNVRQGILKARLKTWSKEDLKQVILNIKASPFHMGDNESGKKYNDFELLFRNDRQVEKYLELGKNTEDTLDAWVAQKKKERGKE